MAGIGVNVRIPQATSAPSAMPMRQPIRVSVAASTRNWNMISPRVAPSALRTPISRVRSVTEIIMIATTPTPPTISADARQRDHHDEEPRRDLVERLEHPSWVTIAKLFVLAPA